MEKFDPKTILRSLSSSLHSVASGNMNPDLSWRIVLALSLFTGIAIGVSALFSYRWAGTLEDPAFTPKADKDTVSAEEIHAVISHYTEKQEKYQSLLKARPTPPGIGKDSGSAVSPGSILRTEIIDVGNDPTFEVDIPN